MTVLDRSQDLAEALVSIVSADAEIIALAGRSTALIVPWNALTVDGPIPVLAYAFNDGGAALTGAPIRTERYEVQCACFAKTKRDANRLAARIPQILTWQAFNARSLDVCQDPERPYRRFWPNHEPVPNSPAQARADVAVTLLVTA